MCPMIKEGDPPISYDLLDEARRSLDRDYGFALGEEDGRRVLFIRSPESKPDPFHSLEVVSFGVAEGDLAGVQDVLLVGDDRVVRVEPSTLGDLVQERREEDPEVAKHLRNRLDRDHDYTVFRHKGARDHLRLGARVPRERVDDLADEDRQALTEELSPILGSPKGREIRAYYLVGDEHARRMAEDEFVETVGAGLREAVDGRDDGQRPPPAEDEPEIETDPPSSAETMGSPRTGPSPGDPGKPAPSGDAGDAGAELIEGEVDRDRSPADDPPSSSTSSSTPSSGDSPSQQPPGAGLAEGGSGDAPGPGGLGGGEPAPDADDDGGAEFLGDPGGVGGADRDEPPPGREASPEASPDQTGPRTDPPEGAREPEPEPSPEAGDPSGDPRREEGSRQPEPADQGTGSGTGGGSGGSAQLSPDDDGVAGLAGRGSQYDRPEPDENGGQAEPDDGSDDVITVDVEQAPDEAADPDEVAGRQASPAQGDPADAQAPPGDGPGAEVDPSGADSPEAAGDPSAGSTPAQPASGTPDEGEPSAGPTGTPSAEPSGTPPAETGPATEPDADPAEVAAARLDEAGYEVVRGVEAGGQPFDFAADRSGGKRLLGLAVETLGADDVEALARAGADAGADAVLVVPLDVEPGAREAAWGSVVDLLPPDAASTLDL